MGGSVEDKVKKSVKDVAKVVMAPIYYPTKAVNEAMKSGIEQVTPKMPDLPEMPKLQDAMSPQNITTRRMQPPRRKGTLLTGDDENLGTVSLLGG